MASLWCLAVLPQLTPRDLELLPLDVVERKDSKMKEGSLSLKQVMDIVDDATEDEKTPVLPFRSSLVTR
jgi:hypothetical protein